MYGSLILTLLLKILDANIAIIAVMFFQLLLNWKADVCLAYIFDDSWKTYGTLNSVAISLVIPVSL